MTTAPATGETLPLPIVRAIMGIMEFRAEADLSPFAAEVPAELHAEFGREAVDHVWAYIGKAAQFQANYEESQVAKRIRAAQRRWQAKAAEEKRGDKPGCSNAKD